jgi:hypothetical protein
MQKRIGLLLIVVPVIASAAFVLNAPAGDAGAQPAPKKIEAPSSTTPDDKASDESRSQLPQHSPGEVIGVPMLA